MVRLIKQMLKELSYVWIQILRNLTWEKTKYKS